MCWKGETGFERGTPSRELGWETGAVHLNLIFNFRAVLTAVFS